MACPHAEAIFACRCHIVRPLGAEWVLDTRVSGGPGAQLAYDYTMLQATLLDSDRTLQAVKGARAAGGLVAEQP